MEDMAFDISDPADQPREPFPQVGPVQWRVGYTVRTLIADEVVSTGVVETCAPDEATATSQAVRWVHDHDVRCDPRLDPLVEVDTVEEIDTLEPAEA